MIFFQQFYLDREKDLAVDLYMEGERLDYVIRTPNHRSGNLICNLARLCELQTDEDENGLKVIRGEIPSYYDGDNRKMYILRLGNTKIANIYPDGRVELKASIPGQSAARCADCSGHHASDPLSLLLYQEAFAALYREPDRRTGGKAKSGGGLTGRTESDRQAP